LKSGKKKEHHRKIRPIGKALLKANDREVLWETGRTKGGNTGEKEDEEGELLGNLKEKRGKSSRALSKGKEG